MFLVFLIIIAVIIGAIYCNSNNTSASETSELLTKKRTSSKPIIIKAKNYIKKQTQNITNVTHAIIHRREKQNKESGKTKLIMSCPVCHKDLKIYDYGRTQCPSCQQHLEFL